MKRFILLLTTLLLFAFSSVADDSPTIIPKKKDTTRPTESGSIIDNHVYACLQDDALEVWFDQPEGMARVTVKDMSTNKSVTSFINSAIKSTISMPNNGGIVYVTVKTTDNIYEGVVTSEN